MPKYKPAAHTRSRIGRRSAKPGGERTEKRPSSWIYGLHAAAAALTNPARRIRRLVATPEGAERLSRAVPTAEPEIVDRRTLDQLLPADAVHQGIALDALPLEQPDLAHVAANAGEDAVVVVLDRVTDPHNVGAVLRSAAAFGATAVVQTERGAPAATGVTAKAASGALDVVPLVTVTNLARALEQLKANGFWRVGLDDTAERTLAEVAPAGRVAIVLGAEGAGLRRLTREHCDLLTRLPTRPPVSSLNVSNAAAVALYELVRRVISHPPDDAGPRGSRSG